ncbi:MAG TPA: DUF748 domain-containing protein, partial [Acidobacteriota bacterium]|nr:DUF748 domain-containing protein [Acidobacteriota bacterium]
MKLPRPIIYLAALGVFVLVLVAIGALLLPKLVDSQLIRDKISAEFTKKTAARVTFAKIAFLWFPRPAVLIENVKISGDDKTEGSIQTAKIYPSIFHLLIGQLVVRRALLEKPNVKIVVPESSPEPFDLDKLEEQIRFVVGRSIANLPASGVSLSDGSADIRIGERPPVKLENITAQSVASRAGVRLFLRARSNLFERLSVDGTLSPESLAAQLDINVRRVKIAESFALLPRQISEYAPQGEASADVKIAAVGLRKLRASFNVSAGPVVFVRHGRSATVDVRRLKGAMTFEGGAFQADVERVDLGSPRLTGSGQIKVHSGLFAGSVKVRDLDVAEVGDLALRWVGDTENVKNVLRYVSAGTISELNLQSAGGSWSEIASSKNIVASGTMRNAKVIIPSADLALTNVSGSVRIADNILEVKDASTNLGTAKGWDGSLRLGLEGKAAPFHLDTRVQAGARELQSVLLRVAPDGAFRTELSKLQNVEGELSGRVILGETMDAISPVVAISQANISATYEPVPFPIVIRSGRLDYEKKTLNVKNARGAVGHSTFGALSVTLHLDGSRQIKVDSEHVALDLQQMDTLVRRFKDLRSYLTKFQSARGHVELHKLALSGAYDEPTGWTFASTGSVN